MFIVSKALLISSATVIVSGSVYVDLQYDEISLTFTGGSVCLCGVSSPVVVLGLFVMLS